MTEKKLNEIIIEKFEDYNGLNLYAVKTINPDNPFRTILLMRCKSLELAENWAYKLAYSVKYINI